MVLQLVGHYDSPFVRRVAVTLNILGMPFERRVLSVFSNAEAVRTFNPAGRVPVLVLEDGEMLIESAAILDYLDDAAGPGRALLPLRGVKRRQALQLMALSTAASDKAIAVVYEHRRNAGRMDTDWVARCRAQLDRALAEIERRLTEAGRAPEPLLQQGITLATMLGYLRLRVSEAVPPGRYPRLEALAAAAEAEAAYAACQPPPAEIDSSSDVASAALLRLQGRA